VNDEVGFRVLRTVKSRLDAYDPDRSRTIWMKTSEIAHYWMARELADIEADRGTITVRSAFPTTRFPLSLNAPVSRVRSPGRELRQVRSRRDFSSGTFLAEGGRPYLAFDLPEGETVLSLDP